MTNSQGRPGSRWEQLTGRPEVHEDPWPADTGGKWPDCLAVALLLLAVTTAVTAMLAKFGAHPMLQFLVTSGLLWLAISAARRWRDHRRCMRRTTTDSAPPR